MNVIEILSIQREGRCLVSLQEKLQQLVKEVAETGKKGKLTITLRISPAELGTVVIDDEVDAAAPKPNKRGSLFYVDKNGGLHREDPQQPEFAEVVKMNAQAAS